MSDSDPIRANEHKSKVLDDIQWWHGASIYQIYPRSFFDSNGDGIGDLRGITQKLDYIAALGVDAIWISPFFTSPMLDFGYDVSEFRNVDPIFGSLDDFDALVGKAHALGLKIVIDQVYSHASDHHRWFTESRNSRSNPKSDWFVWADPKSDGTPPNNWQSLFSGPAWSWDARRGQYYFHNFLPQQPDLNLHSQEVQDELISVGRFWLDRGVDGFRFDAVLHMMHDPQLRDNPPAENINVKARGHDFQDNIFNQGHPEIFEFLKRLKKLTSEYGAIFTVAEVGGVGSKEFMKACTGPDKLDSAYSFDFLYADTLTPDLICTSMAEWNDNINSWPTWTFENHDAPRAISRWVKTEYQTLFARMKMALLCCLRGNIILYQGEELGLGQVEIPYEMVQDPEALRNWPHTLSRDGARTPLPWIGGDENCGFTDGKPWLPIGDDHAQNAIDRQENDSSSLLHLTRRLIALRNEHIALRIGDIIACDNDGDLLKITRNYGEETLDCYFNMGFNAINIDIKPITNDQILTSINEANANVLPAYSVLICTRLT